MATKRRTRHVRDDLWEYKPKEGQDGITRAADFLTWAADRFSKRPVPVAHIVRIALNEPNLPKEESRDVKAFKNSKMGRVRKKLFTEYSRGLIYHPGMGYRATVDSEDVVTGVMEKRSKQVKRSIELLGEAESIVDRKELKSPGVRSRFDTLRVANKKLNDPEIQNRLTPPADLDKEDEPDKKGKPDKDQ